MTECKTNRRQIGRAALATPLLPGRGQPAVAQTPVATPTGEQIALFDAARAQVLTEGREIAGLMLEGDDAALIERAAPPFREVLSRTPLDTLLKTFQTNRVQMDLAAAGAYFDGHYDGSDAMTGFYSDVAAGQFQLDAEEEQGGEVPTGRWNGVLIPGNVSISVVFTGGESDLSATLDTPGFGNEGQRLDYVTFTPEQPIGERVEERALPFNPMSRIYTAAHAWGNAHLVADISFDAAGIVTGVLFTAAWPLPEDPMGGYVSDVAYRLAVDGQLVVFWGGETVLQNYHAAYPSQRHALDIVVWRDGATFSGDGTRNDGYFIWGMPVVAPASGEVVAVENDTPDIDPGQIASGRGDEQLSGVHPAGNHVVIQVAEGEYLLIAHMRQSSVAVAVGDILTQGDRIGLVGNSGNTSEPHLHVHVHVQNVPDFFDPAAVGVPIAFTGYLADGEPVDQGRPTQGQFIEHP